MTFGPFFRKAARLEFVSEIDRAVLRACETPQQFPIVLRDVRQVRVPRFPYSIFFRVKHDRLVVLAIFHARRDPLVWRERA